MKVRKWIASALLLLVLTGCAGPITDGEVVKKEFDPAHTVVRMIPVVRSNGKTTSTTIIPYFYHYPDRWYIKIQQYDAKNGKMRTATYRVIEDVYNSVCVGAEFVYDKDMKPEEPEYTRERK